MKELRVTQIHNEIRALEAELRTLQTECTHPEVALTYTHKCGGEFDNEYSTDVDCGLCGKFWTEEGSLT